MGMKWYINYIVLIYLNSKKLSKCAKGVPCANFEYLHNDSFNEMDLILQL